MIRHIVVFRLRAAGTGDRASAVAAMRERLEPLRQIVPGVLRLEVGADLGIVAGHWDAVLVADYQDNAALEAYQRHPAHVEVVAWLNTLVAERAVVDHELD
ncbi:Dabb family protein [Streptomyces sp. NPDC047000]|uniref:Dabb family protein n=1 Tax=Streptomyces sp. NPDC047000 TaxID=3155474 RepID=UPI0033F97004